MRIIDEYLDKLTMETLLSGVVDTVSPLLALSPSLSKASMNKCIEKIGSTTSTSSTVSMEEFIKGIEEYSKDPKGVHRFYYKSCQVQVYPSRKNSTVRIHCTGLSPKPQNHALDYTAYEDYVRTVCREIVEGLGLLGLQWSERSERWRAHEWKILLPLPSFLEVTNMVNLLSQGYAIKYYCRNRVHVIPRQGLHNHLSDTRSRYVSMTDLHNKLVAWAYTPRQWKNHDGDYRGFYVKGFYEDDEAGENYRISIEHNGVSLKAIDGELCGHGYEQGEAIQVEIERYYDRDSPCYHEDRKRLLELLQQSIVIEEGSETMDIDEQLRVVQSNAQTMLTTLLNSRDHSVEELHQDMNEQFEGVRSELGQTGTEVHAIRSSVDVAYRADQNNRERFLWYLTSRGGRCSSREVFPLFEDQRGSAGSVRDLISKVARELEGDGKIVIHKYRGSRPMEFELRGDGPSDETVVGYMLSALRGHQDKKELEISAPEFFAEASEKSGAPYELARRLFIEHIHANPSHPFALVGKVIRFLYNQELLKRDLDDTRRLVEDQEREQEESAQRLLQKDGREGEGVSEGVNEGGPPRSSDARKHASNEKSITDVPRQGQGIEPASIDTRGTLTGVKETMYSGRRYRSEDKAEYLKRLRLAKMVAKNPTGLWMRLEELADQRPKIKHYSDYQKIKGLYEAYEADTEEQLDNSVVLYQMKSHLSSIVARVERDKW